MFIRVTRKFDKTKVLIKVSAIQSVTDSGPYTSIWFSEADRIDVIESVDALENLILSLGLRVRGEWHNE